MSCHKWCRAPRSIQLQNHTLIIILWSGDSSHPAKIKSAAQGTNWGWPWRYTLRTESVYQNVAGRKDTMLSTEGLQFRAALNMKIKRDVLYLHRRDAMNVSLNPGAPVALLRSVEYRCG